MRVAIGFLRPRPDDSAVNDNNELLLDVLVDKDTSFSWKNGDRLGVVRPPVSCSICFMKLPSFFFF